VQFGVPKTKSNVDESPIPILNDGSISTTWDAMTEEHLITFRQTFLPFFPVVHIPATMSASQLRVQKPFLSLVIMSLTTKSAAQQLAMGEAIRKIVSGKAVAQHERSLDFLLGLVCYLAWSVSLSRK
jgi:hypothetical protein